MTKTWVIADTHFGHANICNFTRNDGSPLRPWDDVTEMDEALIQNWNGVVSPEAQPPGHPSASIAPQLLPSSRR